MDQMAVGNGERLASRVVATSSEVEVESWRRSFQTSPKSSSSLRRNARSSPRDGLDLGRNKRVSHSSFGIARHLLFAAGCEKAEKSNSPARFPQEISQSKKISRSTTFQRSKTRPLTYLRVFCSIPNILISARVFISVIWSEKEMTPAHKGRRTLLKRKNRVYFVRDLLNKTN